jgi:transposase
MRSYIGVDLHLRNATLCHRVDGSEHCLRTLELHSAEWQAFWSSVPAGSDVFVEMSRTTWWFARWVQEQGHQVHVVDPTRSRAMAAGRPKTDRCDARWLAEMGAKDVLHEVYVIQPGTERLRELVRHRALWVRDQTRIKNRIHYQLAREQRRCPHRSVFTQKGWHWLQEQELSPPYAQSLENHRTHFEFVHQEVEKATEQLLRFETEERTLTLLLSIPGIGELTARTLLAEIETIHRFSDPEKLISYAGLAPRVRQSSSMDRRGALTKHGSAWLRTALVESAQIAVRRPNQFQKIFRRVSFRRGRNVGIIATARRLAEVIWHVWSKDLLYQEPARPETAESGSDKLPAATALPRLPPREA